MEMSCYSCVRVNNERCLASDFSNFAVMKHMEIAEYSASQIREQLLFMPITLDDPSHQLGGQCTFERQKPVSHSDEIHDRIVTVFPIQVSYSAISTSRQSHCQSQQRVF